MKLLIIDDSVFSQRMVASLIKKHLENAELYFAKDGYEGFQQYKNIKPDYTFVDLLMPTISGGELIALIKEYDSNAKIIVVSADVQKSVKDEISDYGIVAFLNKPFNDERAKYICDMMRDDSNAR
ncbi:chemotaxis protein CheY [Clostridium homopropionicum DSM 5847]|uniref:Stage 0 sporulation protein A homolog n=1 Tax=Clostridium homopropionicum DSM 5847 TaxID=1121318 RepID=A0A0L6ZEC0_9CLOT|nr:response regulator [Clostridium homopropionicum]KOA21315.1 chemotaxis protein CheY [Clostridium homopropionicum DSM 5847]SFG95574.1 Response regulator receiver domain-containing protein [Clostridium homopropionicum]